MTMRNLMKGRKRWEDLVSRCLAMKMILRWRQPIKFLFKNQHTNAILVVRLSATKKHWVATEDLTSSTWSLIIINHKVRLISMMIVMMMKKSLTKRNKLVIFARKSFQPRMFCMVTWSDLILIGFLKELVLLQITIFKNLVHPTVLNILLNRIKKIIFLYQNGKIE